MPTTLPTLDELLGVEIDGKVIDQSNIAQHLLSLTAGTAKSCIYDAR